MLLEESLSRTSMDKRALRSIEHIVAAIDAARPLTEPFYHLQFSGILPPDIYSEMLEKLPVREDYRLMSGRTKSTRTDDGEGTRIKLDLFPEFIRHLPRPKREVWNHIGQALRSREVREVFVRKLAPALERRFGPAYAKIGMYPIPILTRDRAGYRIGIHPDTHSKGMTIQIYLPRDDSIQHVGTIFHRESGPKTYERAAQMSFLPNSGYAFAVDTDTYHSEDIVGPEVKARDNLAHLLCGFNATSVLAQPWPTNWQFLTERIAQPAAASIHLRITISGAQLIQRERILPGRFIFARNLWQTRCLLSFQQYVRRAGSRCRPDVAR